MLDLHLGRAGRDPARDRARRLGRPRAARRPDGLDAARRGGPPGARSSASCSRYLKQAAALRRGRCCRRRCSSRWRRRCGASSARPIVCTLSGRGPVPRGAARALPRAGEGADRRAGAGRRPLRRDERLLRRLHGRLPRAAARADRRGADRDQLRRARARAAGRARAAVHDRLPRADRAREGAAPAGVGLHPAAPRAGARERRGSRSAGYLAPEHRTYLDGVDEGARRASGSAASSAATRRSTGRASSRSCRASTCCRSRARTPSRRGSTCSRRWRAACRWSSRGTGPSRSSSSRPAAACCSRPGDVRDLAAKLLELASDPARRRELGAARQRGRARATTRPRAWPSARSRSAPRRRPRSRAALMLKLDGRLEGVRHAARAAAGARGRRRSRSRPASRSASSGPPAAARARCSTSSARSSGRARARVLVGGRDVHALAERELAAFRNREVGFVFQDHFLLPQLSVLENVLAPTLVARREGRLRRAGAPAARAGRPRRAACSTGPRSCRAASGSARRSRARS